MLVGARRVSAVQKILQIKFKLVDELYKNVLRLRVQVVVMRSQPHNVLSGYSIFRCAYCQCVGVAAEVAQGLSHCAFPARALTCCRKILWIFTHLCSI